MTKEDDYGRHMTKKEDYEKLLKAVKAALKTINAEEEEVHELSKRKTKRFKWRK
jgi:hypothetical protein